jgi:beta-lactamase regulating signal transducer with metallopeptidase domain
MIERALAEYIVNALWQLPFLAGGAWLLIRAVRPGPLMQHRLWLAVLGVALVLPVFGMDGEAAKQPPHPTVLTQLSVSRDAFPGDETHDGPAHPQARTIRLTATVTHWLIRLYFATVVLGLLRIAHAWRAALHLAGHARETSQHTAELAQYSRRFGVKAPQLRESAEVSSPMVVGAVSPVLLLPEGFAQFTADEVEAALCHELAHIQRHDYLMNVVCQVAALPLVWHPVMYEVQQRIRLTREMVCDAMAAQEMKSQIGYAKCLLALAQSMLGTTPVSRQTQSLGLFSNNAVEERVMRLMESNTMSRRARIARATSGAVVMIAAGAMATMYHVTPTMAAAGTGAAPQAVQAAPAAPPAQPEPSAPPVQRPVDTGHTARSIHRNGGNGRHTTLTATEREQNDRDLKLQIEDMQRQMAEATAHLNNPEFKQQMEDMKQQALKARTMVDSPAFKQQMEDMKRQVANATTHLNSPEFKKQMEDAQRQALQARTIFDSPEFKKQMEDMKRQMAKATAHLNSPEFKKQMEDAQRQIAKARTFVNPEFKRQMEDMQKDLQRDNLERKLDEDISGSKEAPSQPENTP